MEKIVEYPLYDGDGKKYVAWVPQREADLLDLCKYDVAVLLNTFCRLQPFLFDSMWPAHNSLGDCQSLV